MRKIIAGVAASSIPYTAYIILYFRMKMGIDDMASLLLTDPGIERLIEARYGQFKGLPEAIRARMRFFDRELEIFQMAYPTGQYLNLGAGLDTKFPRKDNGEMTFFEVDLSPQLVQLKRQRFETSGVDMSRFHSRALDYTQEGGFLGELVEKDGFVLSEPTIVILEGNMVYLAPHQLQKVLLELKENLTGPFKIIFSCFQDAVMTGETGNSDLTNIKFNTDMGRHWTFGNPSQLLDELGLNFRLYDSKLFFDPAVIGDKDCHAYGVNYLFGVIDQSIKVQGELRRHLRSRLSQDDFDGSG